MSAVAMGAVRHTPKAQQTLSAIVDAAMAISSRRGLQQVTLGAVAACVGITRAGVFARVGSIDELHHRLIEQHEQFVREMCFEPALLLPRGLPRLTAIVDRWIDHGADLRTLLLSHLAATSLREDDVQAVQSRLNARLIDRMQVWRQTLERSVAQAVEQGHLQADTEPAQMAFEVFAVLTATLCDAHRVHPADAGRRARAAYERLLASYRMAP